MNLDHPKVPDPPAEIVLDEQHLSEISPTLWRIHWTSGRHPSSWDALRTVGPIDGMRWDPHSPAGAVPPHGLLPAVSYTATTVYGAFAEVFQRDRQISLDRGRALTAWQPVRPLRLVNLSGSDFGVHNGAAHSLPQVESARLTQRWAQALFAQHGERIDGVLHDSTIIGDPVIALFTRAVDSFPEAPAFSRPLDHVDIARFTADVCDRLRWQVL